MDVKKLILQPLGWLAGGSLFAGLNLYLLVRKFRIPGASPTNRDETTGIIRFDTAIDAGYLPAKCGAEKTYKLPAQIPEDATHILLKISASPQANQLSGEPEFAILAGDETPIHFFLFLKPFEGEPELSYAGEEVVINMARIRQFKIRFEGGTEMTPGMSGEVKIIGYC